MRTYEKFVWTDETKVLAKRLWEEEGFSATMIVERLKEPRVNGPSRSAVIGMVHRLGVHKRAAASAPKIPAVGAPRPRREPTAVKVRSAPVRPSPPPAGAGGFGGRRSARGRSSGAREWLQMADRRKRRCDAFLRLRAAAGTALLRGSCRPIVQQARDAGGAGRRRQGLPQVDHSSFGADRLT